MHALCRSKIADEAMSGATHLRPGFQAMQQAAMNGAFDIIVAEALDRLSRDQEHIAALHKRMGFHDVKIFTKAEGEINEMHIGLGGTMSALFLRQLAQKTHRGLEGRVKAGKSAGGISYGYRAVKTMRADGSVTTGEREIIAEEAAIIGGRGVVSAGIGGLVGRCRGFGGSFRRLGLAAAQRGAKRDSAESQGPEWSGSHAAWVTLPGRAEKPAFEAVPL